MRRRELMQAISRPAPLIPDDYQQVEYVARSSSAGVSGYNSTGFSPNGTDELEIRIGIMATANSPDSLGYPVVCHQKTNDNTIGFGVYYSSDLTQIGAYGGSSALISPNGGTTTKNTRYDIVAKRTTTSISITDGTNSDSVSLTPRGLKNPFYIFGLKHWNYNQLTSRFVGRIYYLAILEGGVIKVNFIPCKRKSDGMVGFYNTVAGEFRSDSNYTAGPDIN